jgi:hypothetical protein
MPIFGLTVSEQGEVMQRLAVTTKVAIGEVVKKNGNTFPQKLDHFVFLRKSAASLEWEPDPDLIKHYTGTCREFWIILLDDQLENVFRTEYAWWTKAEKKCWGDGRNATRRTEKNPDGEEWSPCGETCPDLNENRCKPSGDLYFILADFPRLGSVCRLHTTSYRSIRQIYSALEQIRTVTGGRLAGIRCKLVVRPEKSSFLDPKDKKKKSTTIYALNIELSAADMRSLIGNMTEHAKLFEQTRKLLGDGRKVEYVVEEEPEIERAPDVSQEFHPATEETVVPVSEIRQPARASTPAAAPVQEAHSNGSVECISPEQRRELYKICVEEGWNNEQVKEILCARFGVDSSTKIPAAKYSEVVAFFRRDAVEGPYVATDEDIPW